MGGDRNSCASDHDGAASVSESGSIWMECFRRGLERDERGSGIEEGNGGETVRERSQLGAQSKSEVTYRVLCRRTSGRGREGAKSIDTCR